jgi:hypothetical protein
MLMLWIALAVVAVAAVVRFGILCRRAEARLPSLLQTDAVVEELVESR